MDDIHNYRSCGKAWSSGREHRCTAVPRIGSADGNISSEASHLYEP